MEQQAAPSPHGGVACFSSEDGALLEQTLRLASLVLENCLMRNERARLKLPLDTAAAAKRASVASVDAPRRGAELEPERRGSSLGRRSSVV